jgi:hypothetical protein
MIDNECPGRQGILPKQDRKEKNRNGSFHKKKTGKKMCQTRLACTEFSFFPWARRGSNTGPLDLQSNALPTAPQTLFWPIVRVGSPSIINKTFT